MGIKDLNMHFIFIRWALFILDIQFGYIRWALFIIYRILYSADGHYLLFIAFYIHPKCIIYNLSHIFYYISLTLISIGWDYGI